MPIPNPGEKQADFVSRCIPIVLKEGLNGKKPNQQQAIGACYGMFKEHKKTARAKSMDRTVPVEANEDCVINCLKKILDGDVDRSRPGPDETWEAPDKPADDECIGCCTEDGKERYFLPIIKDGLVSCAGLDAACEQCWREGWDNIRAAIYPIREEMEKRNPNRDPTYSMSRVLMASRGDYAPASAVPDTLPKTRNSLPCFYYWKDAIEPGVWVHPTAGWELPIDDQWIDNRIATFARMQANGVDVPHVKDHKITSDSTLGYIVGMEKREDGKLYELHQFLGETSRDIALKNLVSIDITPNFKDGKGNEYGEAITACASTPIPVVSGQGEYRIAASRARPLDPPPPTKKTPPPNPQPSTGATAMDMKFTDEQTKALSALIPNLGTIAEADKPDALIKHLSALATADDADAGGPDVIKSLSRADIGKKAADNRASWKADNQRLAADNTNLRGQVTQLSAQVIKPISDDAKPHLIETARRDFDSLVSCGITPAVKDQLYSLCIGTPDKPNNLALSLAANPGGTKPFVFALLDILRHNRPLPPLGEHTDVQQLHREVPGDTDPERQAKIKEGQDLFKKRLHRGNPTAAN